MGTEGVGCSDPNGNLGEQKRVGGNCREAAEKFQVGGAVGGKEK